MGELWHIKVSSISSGKSGYMQQAYASHDEAAIAATHYNQRHDGCYYEVEKDAMTKWGIKYTAAAGASWVSDEKFDTQEEASIKAKFLNAQFPDVAHTVVPLTPIAQKMLIEKKYCVKVTSPTFGGTGYLPGTYTKEEAHKTAGLHNADPSNTSTYTVEEASYAKKYVIKWTFVKNPGVYGLLKDVYSTTGEAQQMAGYLNNKYEGEIEHCIVAVDSMSLGDMEAAAKALSDSMINSAPVPQFEIDPNHPLAAGLVFAAMSEKVIKELHIPLVEKSEGDMNEGDELQELYDGYRAAALWAETDLGEGEPLDVNHGIDDIAEDTLTVMLDDCDKFLRANRADIVKCSAVENGPFNLAGHCFWLSRRQHGTGYFDDEHWDEETRDKLQKAAEAFGDMTLDVGDDGKVYHVE